MRTTLDIDRDILQAAKEIAASRKNTAGKVLSDLARKALEGPPAGDIPFRNGFPQLPDTGVVITAQQVEDLLNEEYLEIAREFFSRK